MPKRGKILYSLEFVEDEKNPTNEQKYIKNHKYYCMTSTSLHTLSEVSDIPYQTLYNAFKGAELYSDGSDILRKHKVFKTRKYGTWVLHVSKAALVTLSPTVQTDLGETVFCSIRELADFVGFHPTYISSMLSKMEEGVWYTEFFKANGVSYDALKHTELDPNTYTEEWVVSYYNLNEDTANDWV